MALSDRFPCLDVAFYVSVQPEADDVSCLVGLRGRQLH
jgi:hypothetical protein